MAKPRKPANKPAEKSDPRQLNLLDLIDQQKLDEKKQEALQGLLALKPATAWRGRDIIPAGSFLDKVANLFERTTDFPLEIAIFLALHFTAAYLLDKGAEIQVSGDHTHLPDLWTTILAPSGSGKTLTTSVLSQIIPLRLFPETTSAARFIEELQNHNRTIWLEDEWAQLIKRIENQSYAEELRGYLLRIYDNKPVARNTKGASIEIAKPSLVVVGTTVSETFVQNVSAESMLDGFMQRFQFVIGKPDPERPASDYPIYETFEPANMEPLKSAWNEIAANPVHPVYRVSEAGKDTYKVAFRRLCHQHREVPASFFRRVMWRTFKYAVVYHFLLGKTSPDIDVADIAWAIRASELHLADARELLASYQLNKIETLVRRAEALQDKLGRRLTTRDLVQRVWGIETSATAAFVMRLMRPPASKREGKDSHGAADTMPAPEPRPTPQRAAATTVAHWDTGMVGLDA